MMKKIVIVFGLIAGLIVSALMLFSIANCYNSADFESSMFLGYASMLLAFSFIYVAVKNYRDKYNDGIVSFGKAFRIGLYISLIASTFYVIVWLIDYYVFVPDFMDKYTTHVLLEAKKAGASPSAMALKVKEMDDYKEMYKNPFFVVLLTYTEILPIGLIVSLICALIIKRKAKLS
ncbi:DUF4199 domain-containing protein [Pedobacter mendelii]|uniref:DUF4199 domain-containing protein n=1 Tax=Pedobacter mendelii TaxID=1908240 RepID=A0ABQ2BLV5_9SPHI|nr:DUF4199 domain-containing protein [Pedobacter mendelii]GGI29322.1 hypothetical protein GCM10008119_37050 [Pedobacter mendelii]